ncbi:nucleotidyltransferase domain-containing protein [Chitinibacter bivalviorum]|uniref:Nucleotidyltransferase domain-containing protein n=1 Tax=Chitinibacter bivalviorum TaxID=2739434 RepID=A0A7H9BIT1_9NEIS|nr:nucleotidyltransferase domain-containing protein [Chitinibacter bivalviorum]QLG88555.1 nucleotidyltransferase domain-containing protein [Chitinibacter bivalviorum]
MDIDYIRDIVSVWAASKKEIRRIFLFGSMARRDYGIESDIDLAIDIDVCMVKGVDEGDGFATWCLVLPSYRSELGMMFSHRVDVRRFNENNHVIRDAVNRDGILIYEVD